ncbi:MAG: flagellar basal body-associated FliL family protein [Gammaproteobacteria bacterium]|jgi:flagellar FliL protein
MAEAPAKEGSKLKSIILIAIIVVLLLVIAVGATLFFTGALSHDKAAQDKAAGKPAGEKTVEPQKPPLYLSITPALVVNFQNPQQARFLQVGIDVMARDQKILDAVKQNMPAIRNRLIILLSAQKYADINSPAGKEHLRKQTLQSINDALKESGAKEQVEQVYFTSFVMQ